MLTVKSVKAEMTTIHLGKNSIKESVQTSRCKKELLLGLFFLSFQSTQIGSFIQQPVPSF